MQTLVLNKGEKLENQTFDNIKFKKTLIIVKGDDVVIRNCRFVNIKEDFIALIRIDGKRCLIEDCMFAEFDCIGTLIDISRKNRIKTPEHHIIRDNLFMNRRKSNKNGLEAIKIGTGINSLKGLSQCLILNNRIENYEGETKIISVNSCDNMIIGNVLINCAGTIVLNRGYNSLVAYNLIDGKSQNNANNIIVISGEHTIMNNIIKNIKGVNDNITIDFDEFVFDGDTYETFKKIVLEYKPVILMTEKSEEKEYKEDIDMEDKKITFIPNVIVREQRFEDRLMGKICDSVELINKNEKMNSIMERMDKLFEEWRGLK